MHECIVVILESHNREKWMTFQDQFFLVGWILRMMEKNKRENNILVYLVRENNEKKNWGPRVFSPDSSNCNLPNLKSKCREKKSHLKIPRCPVQQTFTFTLSKKKFPDSFFSLVLFFSFLLFFLCALFTRFSFQMLLLLLLLFFFF